MTAVALKGWSIDVRFTLPVTGGSGAYEGASGQVTVTEDGQAQREMTLLLAGRD
jgi:hypothetical protein